MTTRRLLISFVLALFSYGALFFLFPKTNPAARWNLELDRATAIEKAKAAAASHGYTATNQTETVDVEYNRENEYYLSRQANPLLDSLFTPLMIEVRLNDAKSGLGFEVRLNSRGDSLGFRRREPSDQKSSSRSGEQSPQQTPGADNLADDRKVAEDSLKQFLGERYGKFSFLSASRSGKEDRKFSWVASDDRVRVLADVTVREGKVREIWLQSNPTPKFQAEFNSLHSGAIVALTSAEHLLIWPAIILVIIFYFVGLARRRIAHRQTLVFLLLCFLFLFVSGLLADSFRLNFRAGGAPLPGWIGAAIAATVVAFSLYLFWASGLSLSTGLANRRTIDLELLLKGRLRTRPVTGSVVAGLLAGGLLTAIPHALVATGIFSGAMIDNSEVENVFQARFPALDSFLDGSQYLIFLTFAFLIPVVDAFVKRPWTAQILAFLMALLSLIGLGYFYVSAPALLVAGLLQTLLLVSIYRNYGLLAVIVTAMSAQTALSAAALIAQPVPSLQSSGWRAIAGLGVTAVVALAGLFKSAEVKEEEIAVETRGEDRAVRARLQAEFSVARRAQEQMLPRAAPDVPGFAIAAACNPSREVGGDSYDFLALPDGRLGVTVADVSGKGVPASLYMTLTKGLLDSITEYETDPGEILREVNRHLYAVCRRKMFVTLFLGVIDPGTRTLSYARAGHNPTIIYRASERRVWRLKSPGMGLGLNSGPRFDQSLKVETLRLEPRDKLFFYSDGITEAMNEKNEEYGEERLMAVAAKTDGLNAEQSRDAVLANVAEFLGSAAPQDDQTLVVVQVL
jgi:serine phosphatase RsbU (regulator of sigma subunit)